MISTSVRYNFGFSDLYGLTDLISVNDPSELPGTTEFIFDLEPQILSTHNRTNRWGNFDLFLLVIQISLRRTAKPR